MSSEDTQTIIRQRITRDLTSHIRTIKRMGWTLPGVAELEAYAFSKLLSGPRPCLPTEGVIDMVHTVAKRLVKQA